MADWADELQTKILINAGVNHLDSLRARLGSSIADALRIARAEALEQAAKVCDEIETAEHRKWKQYADMMAQGASDGAGDCAAAIRALIKKESA